MSLCFLCGYRITRSLFNTVDWQVSFQSSESRDRLIYRSFNVITDDEQSERNRLLECNRDGSIWHRSFLVKIAILCIEKLKRRP
jgi:hypothetical protein